MAKNNLLYLFLLAGIFYAFIAMLDDNKAQANGLAHKVSYDVLKYQWVVAEAKEIKSGLDLTAQYQTKMFQFLSSGGFVMFEDKKILKTGSWQVNNHKLFINYDDENGKNVEYEAELVRAEELLLLNENIQLRLLRIQL